MVFELDAIDVAVRETLEREILSGRSSSWHDLGWRLGIALAVIWATVMFGMFTHVVWFVSGALLVALLAWILRPAKARPSDRISLVVAIDAVTVSIRWGVRQMVLDVAEIECFEAMPAGIDVVRHDGTHQPLPFKLEEHAKDIALARRLSRAVMDARTGTGYRGPALEPEDVHEPEQARERR